jgi:cytochrome c oxidase subunit 2
MWKVEHTDGRREINQLHVPIGKAVRLTMISQDVIHSFGIPAFRVKQDVLPGHYTTLWFEATRAGTYHLFCNQYCGTNHSDMVGSVVAMEPMEFAKWMSGTSGNVTPVAAGRNLFDKFGCVACHQAGSGQQGPHLEGVFGHTVQFADGSSRVANEDYVRESILDPQAHLVKGFGPIMPSFRGRVSEEEMMQLIAYIKSLGNEK